MKAPFQKWQNGQHTPEIFAEMCKAHDLTFAFSDQHAVWQAGHEELLQISAAAIQLGSAAKTIWNNAVDNKLAPDARQPFYW